MVKPFIVFSSVSVLYLDSTADTTTRTIYDIMASDGAKGFLDSVSRNSIRSKKTYAAGLLHLQNFLTTKYDSTLKSIIKPLTIGTINVYELLDSFVGYLMNLKSKNDPGASLAKESISLYMTAVRSFLQYHDIDIIPHKFKRKVRLPKSGREDEEPIDASDIRNVLLACNNRRLKVYLLVLASSGLRATEACSIRLCDINFDINPTRIHIRKEYTKTRVARDIYISDEATSYLKQWIDWKYRNQQSKQTPTDLIFTHKTNISFLALYNKLRLEFTKVLSIAGLDERKEGMQRRKITLHTLRRYVKSVIADQVSSDYSDWYIGHSKSSYYTKKEPARRELYATKCMRYLTFLDYTTIETTGKSIEAKLLQRDIDIQSLQKEMKELSDSYEILVQLYEADPQERNKLKLLYREAEKNGTRKPGQLLYLKKSEYTPGSFAYKDYVYVSGEQS